MYVRMYVCMGVCMSVIPDIPRNRQIGRKEYLMHILSVSPVTKKLRYPI